MKRSHRIGAGVLAAMLMAVPFSGQAEDLLDIYRLAVKGDPQLRAAEAAWRAAQETKTQARSLLLPSIAAGAEAALNHDDSDSPVDASDTYGSTGYSLSLTQPLYNRDYQVQQRQADAAVQQADAEFAAARQAEILRVAERYFAVLAALDNLQFARAEKEAIARQLDQATKRFEVGLIAITDVHEAQASYDLAVAAEISAENGVANSWEALNELTGHHHNELSALGEKVPLTLPDPADIEAWVQAALSDNLGLQAANQQTITAREEIERLRSGHYPSIDLVGSHGYSNQNGGLSGSSEGSDSSLSLQLSLSLYQGGAVDSQVRQAQQLYLQASEGLEQSRREVQRLSRDSYRGVHSNISRVQALKQALVSTQSALEATKAGFEVGTRTIVDVLNAQRERYRAERDYAGARYDYILNTLRLKQAAGRLQVSDLEQVNSWLK